jgi:hypothetical protein
MPWCRTDESTPPSEELLRRAGAGYILHFPGLWMWEIVNAVSPVERRGPIDQTHAANLLRLLGHFSFQIAATRGTA